MLVDYMQTDERKLSTLVDVVLLGTTGRRATVVTVAAVATSDLGSEFRELAHFGCCEVFRGLKKSNAVDCLIVGELIDEMQIKREM